MTASSPRALITGASSGIGRATALALAQAGYDLLLVARSPDKLDAVAAEAQTHGVAVQTLCLDLLQLETIQPKLKAFVGPAPIDVLINNAGIGYTGKLCEMPLADWQQVFNLNVLSVFQCIQAVLPQMRSTQMRSQLNPSSNPKIINIASIAAHSNFPNWGAYCASKAALLALSKVLAMEEGDIQVSVVSPGSVNTALWDTETVDADFDRSAMLTPEAVAQAILNVVNMPAGSIIEEIIVMPSGGAF